MGLIFALGLNLDVDLGDIIVAVSVSGTAFIAYQAMKGQIASFSAHLHLLSGRQDKHGLVLKSHNKTIGIQGRQIAGLEGRIYGRRVSDVAPSDIDDADLETL